MKLKLKRPWELTSLSWSFLRFCVLLIWGSFGTLSSRLNGSCCGGSWDDHLTRRSETSKAFFSAAISWNVFLIWFCSSPESHKFQIKLMRHPTRSSVSPTHFIIFSKARLQPAACLVHLTRRCLVSRLAARRVGLSGPPEVQKRLHEPVLDAHPQLEEHLVPRRKGLQNQSVSAGRCLISRRSLLVEGYCAIKRVTGSLLENDSFSSLTRRSSPRPREQSWLLPYMVLDL